MTAKKPRDQLKHNPAYERPIVVNPRYMEAVKLYDSGISRNEVLKRTGLGEAQLLGYLRHFSNRYEARAPEYWVAQKAACEAFSEDLRNAGVKRFKAGPCEFDRPIMRSAYVEISGCSSSAGWD